AAKGESISLALKVAVTAGRVRRFVVGDPRIQRIDVIAGGPVAQIEALESQVGKGQVVMSGAVADALKATALLRPLPNDEDGGGAAAWLADGIVDVQPQDRGGGGLGTASPELEALAQWLLPTV